MPATISAKPNPVPITIWSSTTSAPTTISWDTGNRRLAGKVTVAVDSGVESNVPGAVGDTGSVSYSIELGKQYLFSLRRNDNGTLLATVAVTAQESLGFPQGIVDDIHRRMPLAQAINNLQVIVGPDSARIRFRTRQATIPAVEIRNADTGDTAGSAFPFLAGAQTLHEFEFALAQQTDFNFNILAPSSPPGKDAVQTGSFRTGFRRATVFFDKLDVNDDGDPGLLLGEGDFDFAFGAGDIESGQLLGRAPNFADGISSGESRTLDRSIALDPAPTGLWVQALSQEKDRSFFGDPSPAFGPEGSTWINQADVEISRVTQWLDLSDAGPKPQDTSFMLATGPKHVDWVINGHLRMEAQNGAVLQPEMKRPFQPLPQERRVAFVPDAGGRVALGQGKQDRLLQRPPGGGLYYASASADPRGPRWNRIAASVPGPLTAIDADDGLHLISIGRDGAAFHLAISADSLQAGGQGDEKWRALGGRFAQSIAGAVARGAVELFGVTPDGVVLHRTLAGQSREWEKIGSGVAGDLSVFTPTEDAIGIVAGGRNGEILHRSWSARPQRGMKGTWQSLGRAPQGLLAADIFDGIAVLAVLGDDEIVQAAPWKNYPEPPKKLAWKRLGTINSLLDQRFSLIRRRR